MTNQPDPNIPTETALNPVLGMRPGLHRMKLHKMFHAFDSCWHYIGEREQLAHNLDRSVTRYKTPYWYQCCLCGRRKQLWPEM